MKGRVKDPTEKQELVCRQCRAVYDIECGDDQSVKIIPRQVSYVCASPCGTRNWIGIHLLKQGQEFVCGACDKKIRVEYQLVYVDANSVSQG
jgi:DNA-directed RNA polymerase subunit RPC12/RpoP